MLENFRHFRAGPDPFGRSWQVDFLWLQTAIAIRRSDTVDVKFLLSDGQTHLEKVIALPHADLVALSQKTGRPLTDPWCSRLAALHLIHGIETGEDLEKDLVTVSLADLERYSAVLGQEAQARG